MENDVEVFVMFIMIIALRARVLQGATCETHLNLNLAKPAETGTRYKQRLHVLSSDKYKHKHKYKAKSTKKT